MPRALSLAELKRTAAVVAECGGSRSAAARKLGVTLQTVINRLRQLEGGTKRPIHETPAAVGGTNGENLAPGAMAPGTELPAVPPLSDEARQRWEAIDQRSRRELWKKWAREGRDEAMRNYLLELELPFVQKCAEAYALRTPGNVDVDDLVQDARLRLIAAVKNFDPERAEFSTWATLHIRGGMIDGIREQDPVPRLVRTMSKHRLEWVNAFKRRRRREPSDEEAMAGLGWSRQQWAASFPRGTESIEKEIGAADFDRMTALRDVLQACEEAPESALHADEFWREATRSLTPDEFCLLHLYVRREATMKNIGAALGLSESRVSQMMTALKVKVERKLRAMLELDAA